MINRILFSVLFLFCIGCDVTDPDVDRVLKAKHIVRQMVNYPDTLDFHEFDTQVIGNTVTLKFTCKNGFGVPQTHSMNIRVD